MAGSYIPTEVTLPLEMRTYRISGAGSFQPCTLCLRKVIQEQLLGGGRGKRQLSSPQLPRPFPPTLKNSRASRAEKKVGLRIAY